VAVTRPAVHPRRLADSTGTPYARPHPAAPQPVTADPGANMLDWHQEVAPRAALEVPPGHLAIRLANATPTSVCDSHSPGDLCVVPADEGRILVRTGYAREVRTG
jgi:hypothetical protein